MRYLFILLLAICAASCFVPGSGTFLTEADIEHLPATQQDEFDNCTGSSFYIPDTNNLSQTPMKYIKVNFHVMRDGRGNNGFSENVGNEYMKKLLWHANKDLKKNRRMALPLGNNTPNLPIQFQYKLWADPSIPGDDGIYYHNDDDLYYFVKQGKDKNNFNKDVFKKYGSMKGEVLNIFVMTHHPDSLKSKSYSLTTTGIAFDSWVKVAGLYSMSQDTTMKNGKPYVRGAWFCKRILNHEIGHVLGLRHTWSGNDGCDDTPNNPNCWAKPCRTPGETPSNNVMDYNVHSNAWTPCQIGQVHEKFSKKGSSSRRFLEERWCHKQEGGDVYIRGRQDWRGARDLEGDLIIGSGATLRICCRVSMPEHSRIIVRPGGTLILESALIENTCGKLWDGIQLMGSGTKKGKVFYKRAPKILNVKNKIDTGEGQI